MATGGTALVSTTAITASGTYYVDTVNAAGCASARTSVAVTINAVPSAPTASTQSFCGSTTVASLVPAPLTNRRWYNVATGGTALATTTAISASGTYYVDTVSAAGCVSATRTLVAVTINTKPTAPTASAQSFCGSTTVASLVPATSSIIRWYSASTGGTALATTTAISASGTYYVDTVSAAGCVSATRTSVAVTINTKPTAPTASAQSFCGITTVASLVPAPLTNRRWFNVATGGTALVSTTAIIASGTYYVDTISAAGCVSATRTAVAVTISTAPIISSISPSTVCTGNTVTLTTSADVSQVLWQINGSTISTDNSPVPISNITTVAGTGVSGSAANQLYGAASVYIDGSGNIFVADEYNHRIQKWAVGASSGTTVAGGNGQGNAANQLAYPSGVYVDGSGNVYVADRYNHRIQKWTPGATSGVTVAGTGVSGSAANQLNNPKAVFVDGSGNIFVAEESNHRIQKWATGASSGITVAGGNGQGNATNQLNNPTGLFVDGSGNIFVVDQVNNRIQKFASGASNGTTVAGGDGQGYAANQLGFPKGLYVDGSGNIFVADYFNHRIQKWTPGATSGFTVAGTGSSGTSTNQISYPKGVFVDGSGAIFVADEGNHRIQKWVAINQTSVYSPTVGGSLTAVVKNSAGCTVTSTVVTVNGRPTAPAGVDQSFCGNTTVANLIPPPLSNRRWYNVATGGTALANTTAITATGTYYVDTLSAAGCASNTRTAVNVTINSMSDAAMAMVNLTQMLSVSTTTHFGYSCTDSLIAKLEPNGANPISGNTTAKVWIEGTQPSEFVKRHYEITPTNGASTATGRITLYFTQQEFGDFNNINYLVTLPTDPWDGWGRSNLLIEKRGGVSSDGTGLPNTYTGTITTIDPDDNDIIWNTTANRWEITFDVDGFSGFFVKTTSGILPLKWLDVNAKLIAQNQVAINWKVQETNVATYSIEKSIDGISFALIGNTASKGDGINNYRFLEGNALQGTGYYRIKQIDKDGRFSYSYILKVSNQIRGLLSIYPNPVKNKLNIIGATVGSKLELVDISGKQLFQLNITQSTFTIDLSLYPSGVYILKTDTDAPQKIIKQ